MHMFYALLRCGYIGNCIETVWSIYPYTSGLLIWHRDNRMVACCQFTSANVSTLNDMGKSIGPITKQNSTSRQSCTHYSDVIMSAIASEITGVSIVRSTVCSGADKRKHQSSASLAFKRGIRRRPVNSSHKGPVTRKMFPFDDVIITILGFHCSSIDVALWPYGPTGDRQAIDRTVTSAVRPVTTIQLLVIF